MNNASYICTFEKVSAKEKMKFKTSHCCLPVSVGMKYHEEGKMKGVLNLVHKNFEKCTLILADTLQRYNFESFDQDHNLARKLARIKGDEWLMRHQSMIKKFHPNIDILRWDEWINQPSYPSYLNKVQTAYNTVSVFKDAVDKTHDDYIKRKRKSPEELYPEKLKVLSQNCFKYLFEECAVSQMWAEEGYNFQYEIYPYKRTAAFKANFNLYIVIANDFARMANLSQDKWSIDQKYI